MAEKASKAGEAKKATAAKTTKTKTAKKAPAKVAQTEAVKTEAVKTDAPKAAKAETTPAKNQTQSIVIAVLATAIVFILIIFGVLLATGVIKFGNDMATDPNHAISNTEPTDNNSYNTGNSGKSSTSSKSPSSAGTTENGAECYNGTRVQVERLEACLPRNFTEGNRANDGAYTYNLTNDDGWAEVHAYFLKTSRTPTQFINYLSSNLKVTNQNYTVNGITWVRAEAGDYMQAFATKSGDYLYAIFYTIKLDSDSTREAWKMIPQTITLSNLSN